MTYKPTGFFEFEVANNIDELAFKFRKKLSREAIEKALKGAIAKELRDAKKQHMENAKKTHNVPEELMKKGINVRAPNFDKGKINGALKASSKPLSLKAFVVAINPLATQVKSNKNWKNGFLAAKIGGKANNFSDAMGVFIRDADKWNPSKGRWANYVVKRGVNKGRLIQRGRIYKRYTASIGPIFNSSSKLVLDSITLASQFEEYLQKEVDNKNKK